MIKTLMITIVALLITSCSSDPFMRKEFNNPRVLEDPKTNIQYIVEHNFGDNYSVTPLVKHDLYNVIKDVD